MNVQVENFLDLIKYAINQDKIHELPKLREPVDWADIMKRATSHNLLAMLHEVAYQYPEYRDSVVYTENEEKTIMIVAEQMQKTEMFLELYRAFIKEDLHPIVIKGLICRQLYGKYGDYRPSGDEDILIQQEDFYKVKTVMESLGYICERENITETQLDKLQEIDFYEKRSGFLVEVHTNVMGHENKIRTKMGKCFNNVFENIRVINIRDLSISTMSHTEHMLFLILHAFKHFTLTGVGVRQMLDILLYQEKYEEDIDWEYVKEVLDDNHATEYFGDLQSIGVKYLGVEAQVRFQTCAPESLLEDMVEVGVFGKKEDTDILAARINLSTMEQKSGGLWALMRAGFPSISYMRNAAPYLDEKPWLLPLEWIKRWKKFLKLSKSNKGIFVLESLQKSKKRKQLLKKYGF